MAADELVPIVNEQNEVIKVVTRAQMRREHLPHRASYIALCDRQGYFAIEVRTLSKDYAPGLLDACVGGVMQTGEDPEVSAKRELKEELGIDADKIEFIPLGTAKLPMGKHGFMFAYLYFAKGDALTRRQDSEVSGLMRLSPEQMLALSANFAPDSMLAFKLILEKAKALQLITSPSF